MDGLSIGEIGRRAGVQPSAIRYYERIGLLPKSAYIPFSAGPRVCIGSAFAMAEARLLLATIVQRYHLALSPGQKVEAEALMSRHIKGGLNMELVARAW